MAELLVYSDWHGRAGPRLLGTLAAQGVLSLTIDGDDPTADYSVALRTARDFRLSPREAEAALARIREAVAPWRAVAASFAIPARQIESFHTAFAP